MEEEAQIGVVNEEIEVKMTRRRKEIIKQMRLMQ